MLRAVKVKTPDPNLKLAVTEKSGALRNVLGRSGSFCHLVPLIVLSPTCPKNDGSALRFCEVSTDGAAPEEKAASRSGHGHHHRRQAEGACGKDRKEGRARREPKAPGSWPLRRQSRAALSSAAARSPSCC